MPFRVIIFVACLLVINAPFPSKAEECQGSTCIDVTTDGQQEVLITVRKKTPGATTTPRPGISTKPAIKRPWIPWLPKPVIKRTATPRPRQSPTITRISGSAVMDQVRSLIPRGFIMTQPGQDYLVHQPITFRTNIPPRFVASLVVLRIPIQIELEATYVWSFGDGRSLVTKDPGKPYPMATITNTYAQTGSFTALLEVRWSGIWRAAGISAPINGSIIQRYTHDINVHPALAHFTR